jgi:hypothetical protein
MQPKGNGGQPLNRAAQSRHAATWRRARRWRSITSTRREIRRRWARGSDAPKWTAGKEVTVDAPAKMRPGDPTPMGSQSVGTWVGHRAGAELEEFEDTRTAFELP